jgi:hypothetical protein
MGGSWRRPCFTGFRPADLPGLLAAWRRGLRCRIRSSSEAQITQTDATTSAPNVAAANRSWHRGEQPLGTVRRAGRASLVKSTSKAGGAPTERDPEDAARACRRGRGNGTRHNRWFGCGSAGSQRADGFACWGDRLSGSHSPERSFPSQCDASAGAESGVAQRIVRLYRVLRGRAVSAAPRPPRSLCRRTASLAAL